VTVTALPPSGAVRSCPDAIGATVVTDTAFPFPSPRQKNVAELPHPDSTPTVDDWNVVVTLVARSVTLNCDPVRAGPTPRPVA